MAIYQYGGPAKVPGVRAQEGSISHWTYKREKNRTVDTNLDNTRRSQKEPAGNTRENCRTSNAMAYSHDLYLLLAKRRDLKLREDKEL